MLYYIKRLFRRTSQLDDLVAYADRLAARHERIRAERVKVREEIDAMLKKQRGAGNAG